ncbi:oligosaccharide flippase family protein [Halorussus gelatinilyticus]|uniref:Oligosaccharide flippase family protein n=1 Tax=Halorussus gelatinilyticus TaxID=2937524 RepID=A0A8U0IJ78_9EURY|nr:oligosaccharide flippase family protein [Halorussus gelatinilyticus]UPW00314.1 oligosaccharide flippase family protein [Halorussus gelatinilyticus]
MKVGAEVSKRFVTNVVGTLAAFLGTFFFTRELGFDGIGVYAIFLSLQMIAANVSSFGLYSVVVKRVSEGSDEARHFTSGVLILLAGVVAVAVVVVPLRGFINSILNVEAAFFVPLGVLSWGLFRLSGSFLEGKQRVALVGAIENGRYALIVPIQTVLVLDGYGVKGLIWGLVVGQFLTFLVSYVGFARVVPARPSRGLFREFVDYSKYAYVKSVSSQLFKQADYLLLGQFVGTGVTGVYKNVFTLTEASMLFSSALAQVAFPQFSALTEAGDDEEVGRLLGVLFTYAGVFAVPILGGGAVVGNALLLTLYGQSAGSTVLPVVGVVGLANALVPVLAAANLLNGYREGLEKFFLGTGKPKLYAVSGLLLIVVYSALVVPLTVWYGSWGTAWATVVAFGASVGAMFFMLEEPVPPSALGDVGRQVAATLVMTGVVYGLKLQFGGASGAVRLGVLLGVGATTYFAVLFTLSERIRIDAVAVARDLRNMMLS